MQSHWAGYQKAIDQSNIPATSNVGVAIFKTTDDTKGKTGFIDLTPKKPELQARYDAMSGSWEGVKASEGAIKSGVFTTEFAPLK
jgi:hypothetical protein